MVREDTNHSGDIRVSIKDCKVVREDTNHSRSSWKTRTIAETRTMAEQMVHEQKNRTCVFCLFVSDVVGSIRGCKVVREDTNHGRSC